jgi:hypothetical protein
MQTIEYIIARRANRHLPDVISKKSVKSDESHEQNDAPVLQDCIYSFFEFLVPGLGFFFLLKQRPWFFRDLRRRFLVFFCLVMVEHFKFQSLHLVFCFSSLVELELRNEVICRKMNVKNCKE